MNKVMLIGRIVKEPAIFGEGTALVARYTLAINGMGRNSEITNFIPCVAFGRNAEIAEKYFKKGLKVAVTGSIGNNNYTNRNGKKVYQMLVIAEMQEFDIPKIFSSTCDDSPFENNETNQETIEAKGDKADSQKTGHWINRHNIYANKTFDTKVCSECQYEYSYDAETGISNANFCPYCGAKMEGE